MDKGRSQSVELKRLLHLMALYKAGEGACALCSLYYGILSIEGHKYAGDPPSKDTCRHPDKCRSVCRERYKEAKANGQ